MLLLKVVYKWSNNCNIWIFIHNLIIQIEIINKKHIIVKPILTLANEWLHSNSKIGNIYQKDFKIRYTICRYTYTLINIGT